MKGVRLVISDAHEGLKQAISTVLTGTTSKKPGACTLLVHGSNLGVNV